MYRPVCSDIFLALVASIGLEELNISYRTDGIEYAGTLDVLGSLIHIEGESPSVTEFHFDVLSAVRRQLLALIESDGLDTDDSAAVLGCVASLDEMLHGPSYGRIPGQQAIDLGDS